MYPLNGTYYLMSDLDLFGISGKDGWTLIGFSEDPNRYFMDTRHSFTGTFDGNGCVIRNLQINCPEIDCQGVFGRVGPGAKLINIENKSYPYLLDNRQDPIQGSFASRLALCVFEL